MSRTERFSPVLRVAETKKRNAARVAVKAKQKLHEYERKLDELCSFRREYRLCQNTGDHILTANQLLEHQKFIRQLDEGINILKNKVEGQKHSTDIDKQAWLEAHKHSDALDKLMTKMQKIETDLRETRTQSELDNHTLFRRSKN